MVPQRYSEEYYDQGLGRMAGSQDADIMALRNNPEFAKLGGGHAGGVR